MGLDMYLSKKTCVKNWDHTPKEDRFSVLVKKGGKKYIGIKPERIAEIEEEIGYWRKANMIHAWFVKNIQGGEDNCGDYFVSEEDITTLLSLVKKVLKNKKLAEELLPTTSGFFFGSENYDEYYFKDLENTKEILENALVEIKNGGDIYYSSSW